VQNRGARGFARSQCRSSPCEVDQPGIRCCRASAVLGWRVCRMHGARGGTPEGRPNGNYRHGVRSRKTIELLKLIKSLR
jgi:hypothetical protein